MLLKNQLVFFCVTQINKRTHILDFVCLPRNGVMSSNPRKYKFQQKLRMLKNQMSHSKLEKMNLFTITRNKHLPVQSQQ